MAKKYNSILFVPKDDPWLKESHNREEVWQRCYDAYEQGLANCETLEQVVFQAWGFSEMDDSPEHLKRCFKYIVDFYQRIND